MKQVEHVMKYRKNGEESEVGLTRPGSPSFFGAPLCYNLKKLHTDVAFLGVPFDGGTNDRPGSRFGPLSIRDASMRFQRLERGWYDMERGMPILRDVSLADCGDVDIRTVDIQANFAKITAAVERILEAGSFPAIVGGDHSISFPSVRAFGPEPLRVVHFDAHMDFTHEWKGIRCSYDNPMRRVLELPFVEGLIQIGLRSLLQRDEPYEAARKMGVYMVTSYDLVKRGVAQALEGAPLGGRTYITIDIDVLDPAVAPGTGFPEPGGINYYQLREALLHVSRRCQVVGFDLVEVNPTYDYAGVTSRLAARIILDLLGAVMPNKD